MQPPPILSSLKLRVEFEQNSRCNMKSKEFQISWADRRSGSVFILQIPKNDVSKEGWGVGTRPALFGSMAPARFR